MAKKIKRSKIFKKTLRQGFWKKQPKKKMVHKVVAYQQQESEPITVLEIRRLAGILSYVPQIPRHIT
jgi:hypothetical protein